MDGSRTREALAEFLDYLAEKGLMARATAQARKASAAVILGILDPEEASDVTLLDVDDVVARFHRLHGKKYTPGSLNTYKSRLKSAIEDFASYLANPLAFRPSVQNRERSKQKVVRDSTTSPAKPASPPLASAAETRTTDARPQGVAFASSNILPIPIRADLTIFIQGLPYDLTESEARKISAVITALGQP